MSFMSYNMTYFHWDIYLFNDVTTQIPAQFVEAMLSLHTKFSEMITTVFNKDQLFTKSLDMVRKSNSSQKGRYSNERIGVPL